LSTAIMKPISEEFVGELVAELDDEDVAGIVLGGSHARGDATGYSDVDIACFVRDERRLLGKRFAYREGYLVSIGTKSVAGVRADMRVPNRAIWVVPGLSGCRVLLDKDGSVSGLLREIETFTWGPLQGAADGYASFAVMMLAEVVHKILGEVLVKCDELAVSYATSKLVSGLTEAVAVQRGVLVRSDSTYYRQAQEAAGLGSAWTRYHHVAVGVEAVEVGLPPAVARGVAALWLYGETVGLLRTAMDPAHLEVAEQAMRVVEEAGLGLSSERGVHAARRKL
jgi:predicted nucleotidyltransferase